MLQYAWIKIYGLWCGRVKGEADNNMITVTRSDSLETCSVGCSCRSVARELAWMTWEWCLPLWGSAIWGAPGNALVLDK